VTTSGDSRRAMRARHKKACKGKHQYPSMRAAELFATTVRVSDPEDHRDMDAYRCLNCGAHHVGHKPFVIRQAKYGDEPPEREAL
jgi:hypothetical protein